MPAPTAKKITLREMRAAGVRGEYLAPSLSHTKLLNISHRFRSGTEPTKFRFSAKI